MISSHTLARLVTLEALEQGCCGAPSILDISEGRGRGGSSLETRIAAWHALSTASLAVRIHHGAHVDFYDDLRFCRAAAAVDTVLLSICESAHSVELAAMSGCAIWPMISTAAGVLAIESMAAAKGVARLVLCEQALSQALGLEAGSEGEQRSLDIWRARMVAVSCAYGLAAPVLLAPCVRHDRSIEQQLQLLGEMGFGGQITE